MTTKQQLAKEFDEKFPYLYRNLLERSRESDWEYQNDKIHLFLDQAYDRIREEALREADEAMQLALYKAEKQDPRWAPVRLRGWAHCKRVALEAIHSLITKK